MSPAAFVGIGAMYCRALAPTRMAISSSPRRAARRARRRSPNKSSKPSRRHIGIHMTPHQFRHFAATSYLEHHPEDFETARSILGHAWSKTTRIYAGSSSRRASRAYNQFLFKQREELKLKRPRQEAGAVRHMRSVEASSSGRSGPRPIVRPSRRPMSPVIYLMRPPDRALTLPRARAGSSEPRYRRWLGFLTANYPDDLLLAPADRITPERVRAFINHLSTEIRPKFRRHRRRQSLLRGTLDRPENRLGLAQVAQITPCCPVPKPEDRFDRLVPPWRTLDFGIELMDEALKLPITGHKQREIQYRDGLLLALLSLWPIRRRSIAALTVTPPSRI